MNHFRRLAIVTAAAVFLAFGWMLCQPRAALTQEPSAKEVQRPTAEAKARLAAVRKLALDKNPATGDAPLAALGDDDPLVRRLAIYGLERIGDPAAAPRVAPLLKDPDEWVRRTAAVALGKLRSPQVVPQLVEALKADDVKLRLEAFVALGRIGDRDSQQAIIEGLQDKRLWSELEPMSQMALLHVLDRPFFTDRDVVPFLKNLLGYATWPHPELEKLEPIRRQQSGLMISNGAAQILAVKFGDASGEDWLIKGLVTEDDYVQQASVKALGCIKSKKAVPGLIKVFEGNPGGEKWSNSLRYAIEALGAIGDAEAVPALEKFLTHADYRLRSTAAAALEKIDGRKRDIAPDGPAAVPPKLDEKDLQTPGNKRPPQFIVLGVDDCANIEGLEAMLDICETLHEKRSKAVFTMWLAPLAGDGENTDLEKKKLILQRLFDLGCEIAHHTLHHNPDGYNWASLPRERQIEEIEGCTQWYRDNIAGFTRPFSHKGGGGGHGAPLDPQFTRELLARQNFLYRGGRGQHPNEQNWPTQRGATWIIPSGSLDSNAPPVHATITDTINSDYPGRFDFPLEQGVAMWKANFDYHYNHPRRPILAVNAFHDWGLKRFDDSTIRISHHNESAILKAFLLDVLVKERDKYPEAYCVTFSQVLEYTATGGDLKQTLAAGNCQDSRNPVKPKFDAPPPAEK